MLTDAELDHRAEVARLDGNYLALELIRELRQLHTRIEAMAAVVAAAEAYVRSMQTTKALSLDGLAYRELHVAKNRAALIASVAEHRAALDGYGGAK